MESIVDNLRHLQALAINAATDTNTDDDRATIQKEIVQRLDEINDIASHTNFNGKYLLNGDYGKRTVYDTQTVTTSGVITTYTTVDTEAEIISTTTIDTQTEIISTTTVNTTVTVTDTTTNTTTREVETTTTVESEVVVTNTSTITTTTVSGVAEPTGTAVLLSAGNTTITQDGVYDLAGYSGTLTISAANVKLTNSKGGTLNEVYIEDSGLQKLWLDGINITNSQDKSAIAFSASGNALCLKGSNSITSNYTSDASRAAKIYAGGGLTITGNGSLTVTSNDKENIAAIIGSNMSDSCGSIIIDSGVTLVAKKTNSVYSSGAIIGSSHHNNGDNPYGYCGDIIICSGATVTASTHSSSGGAPIGSGYNNTCGNIVICSGAVVNVTPVLNSFAAGIGNGSSHSSCGNITIHSGAEVTVTQGTSNNTAIGVGYQGGSCGTITIYSDANVKVPSASYIGSSPNDSSCAGIVYPSSGVTDLNGNPFSNYIANSTSITTATSYYYGYSDGKSSISELTESEIVTSTETQIQSVEVPTTVTVTETTTETTTRIIDSVTTITETVTVPTTTTLTETVIVPTTTTIAETSTGLVTSTILKTSTIISNAYFQWGAKSNQSTALNINDMHTKSLRGEVPSRTDTERLNAMDSDSAEYSSFMATLEAASSLTLDDISVGTRENANVAICVINGALEYALDVSTTLGAHSKRMEFAAYNVTTMAENVQASESVIRDTDMAKAMTGYTKANVLRQAAQSMLAQANQNGANVLSLLRQ